MSKIGEDKKNPKEQRRRKTPILAEQLGRQRPRAGSLGSLYSAMDTYKRKREEIKKETTGFTPGNTRFKGRME